MILIGDVDIPFEKIQRVHSKEDIKNTQSNSIVLFDFDIELLSYTQKNNVSSAVIIKDTLESIYAHNLDAKYIITKKELASKIQDLADHYLFDSKVLAIIEDKKEIEELAVAHIDGVIYSKVLGE